jgi:hypothetical protein
MEFIFGHEIEIQVEGRGDVWVFKSDEIGIRGFGLSRQEALAALRQDFAACWDNIALEEDCNLTQDAIEMKNLLKSVVISYGQIE